MSLVNNSVKRRVFIMQVVAGVSALSANQAFAQTKAAAPVMLLETDATATGLGYKADSAKVDSKKYPKHQATQLCSSCQLYTGKDKEAAGPCQIFPGKQVAAKGWCSAWVKKA